MNKIMKSLLTALIVGAFALTACGGKDKDKAASGDKCSKAVNHSMSLGMEMIKGMAGAMGDKGKEMIAEAEKEMKAKTPEAISKCQAKLKAEPEKVGKTLDCLIAAKDAQSMEACEGARELMKD